MSDYNTMTKYLASASQAVQYVKGIMDIGAANKIEPLEWIGKITRGLCAGGTFNKGELMKKVEQELALIPGASNKEYVDVLASWAKHYGCGNCGPQSAVAFVYLREYNVRPLDWMRYANSDHGFVIIGRPKDSDPVDINTWGKTAVICDPWRNEAVPVFPYAHLRFLNKRLELLYREE